MNKLTHSTRPGLAHRPGVSTKSATPQATPKPATAPSPGTPPKLGKPPGGIGTRPTPEELLVKNTIECAAILLSRVLGRPVEDMRKALASDLLEAAKGGSGNVNFPGALEAAKSRIAGHVRAGVR